MPNLLLKNAPLVLITNRGSVINGGGFLKNGNVLKLVDDPGSLISAVKECLGKRLPAVAQGVVYDGREWAVRVEPHERGLLLKWVQEDEASTGDTAKMSADDTNLRRTDGRPVTKSDSGEIMIVHQPPEVEKDAYVRPKLGPYDEEQLKACAERLDKRGIEYEVE